MDALLIALLASGFAEIGDKTQLLALAFAVRFRNDGVVLGGIALATILNCALSATAGWLIADMIGTGARTLFFALPLLFAGIGMWLPVQRPDTVGGWKIGAFLTTFLAMFILEFGDKSQFIVAGVAVRTADPVMSAIGASIGITAAIAPAVLLRQEFFIRFPLALVRKGAGAVFLLIGALVGLGALGLV
ncbi:MAG: TMEM165/GDT1 family protein [Alphaproteobacteria bacterium]|nr:TMEM165/GDT1 family protein [Alphaproteobacteria bacterium]